MLKRFFQKKAEKDKVILTNIHTHNYSSFFLKEEKWEAVRKSRNWPKRGSASRLAEHLNPRCTRQYTAMVISQTCGCSAPFMKAFIDFLGIIEGDCWCHLFRRSRTKGIKTNHPIFNEMKYMGEVPYEKLSLSAEFRKGEYETETK